MKKSIVILAVLAAFGSFGCSKTCEDMCEEAKECPGASAELKGQDCAASCADAERIADNTKCRDQYDDMIGCAGDSDEDACNESDSNECKEEASAYVSCTVAACMTNASLCE